MLLRLSISNYALIRDLNIEFNRPFSVITGETGAGKSIILGALSLILGNRADSLVLPEKNRKCCIEGTFDISRCELDSFFEENNLDYDNYCIIRREITPQGKSRAFINDTPVNLVQLKELTESLIDVHSQHQTLLLRENSFQLSVVDAVADNRVLLKQYAVDYKLYKSLIKELEIVEAENRKAKAELDYLNFMVDEFRKATLLPDEQAVLEEELDVQSHAEEIKINLYNAAQLLLNDDDSIIKHLKDVVNKVEAAARHYPEAVAISERLGSCLIELRDIAGYIDDSAEKITYDSARMELINERLSIIYKLLQKHSAKNVNELIQISEELESRIESINTLDQKIEYLERDIKTLFEKLNDQADNISARRKEVSESIENSIEKTINEVGIKDGSFKILLRECANLSVTGKDEVKFLFSANKGNSPSDIAKIASGGELSRLMLAVKSLISTNILLPTIVFDEIDTGISGDVAGKVGAILKKISMNMQVITITHLPQIAALSDEHFKVSKSSDEHTTWTEINKLTSEDRIDELALMISGNQKLQGAREAAMELISNSK